MTVNTQTAELSLALTVAFAAMLVMGLLVRLWLISRQIRHVAQHRSQVPVAFAATIALSSHQKAADYTIAKLRLGLLDAALSALILVGWTLLGGLSLLNQTLAAWQVLGTMGHQLALLAAFMLINGLLELPLSLYQTFVLEERFGFNKTTRSLWLTDLAKSSLVAALLGLPIAALILWLMGAAGALWWFWAWGTWMVFNLLALWLFPTYIAPLFNRFTALQDEALKTRVTALMQQCGFAAQGLFVMDGSKRSAHGNAYFTGFGASKRVVFYDTLLAKLSVDEVAAVLAHELGHFKHRHIQRRMVMMFAMSLIGFALIGWLANQPWFFTGLGVRPNMAVPTDALALLLFLLSMPVFSFFIAPALAWTSRRDEFQADAFAKAKTSGHDLSSALLKLYDDNASTLTPDPVYVSFYYSHPPAAQRLARLAEPGPGIPS
jgi:STE24 endopeptidase